MYIGHFSELKQQKAEVYRETAGVKMRPMLYAVLKTGFITCGMAPPGVSLLVYKPHDITIGTIGISTINHV